jgi:translation initiation factor 4G
LQREKEEREKAEREQAEQERLAREAEAKRLAEEAEKKVVEQTPGGRANEVEEGEIFDDQDTPSQNQDGRDKVRESLCIDTNAPAIGRRRHPGPLDLEEAKKSNIAGPQSALATAR